MYEFASKLAKLLGLTYDMLLFNEAYSLATHTELPRANAILEAPQVNVPIIKQKRGLSPTLTRAREGPLVRLNEMFLEPLCPLLCRHL